MPGIGPNHPRPGLLLNQRPTGVPSSNLLPIPSEPNPAMLTTTSTSLRRLPMFFAYCPDVRNGLAARLKVRETHLTRWKEDMKTGHAGESGGRCVVSSSFFAPSILGIARPCIAGTDCVAGGRYSGRRSLPSLRAICAAEGSGDLSVCSGWCWLYDFWSFLMKTKELNLPCG